MAADENDRSVMNPKKDEPTKAIHMCCFATGYATPLEPVQFSLALTSLKRHLAYQQSPRSLLRETAA
jgi:hypothetical protein